MPYTPQKLDGIRTEPAWSQPKAMSASPLATSAALPDEEPPAEKSGMWGLRTTPVLAVTLAPETQRNSQTALPVIAAPASSRRVTTVASNSGTKPSRIEAPFIMGTCATNMLSLMATVLPARGACAVALQVGSHVPGPQRVFLPAPGTGNCVRDSGSPAGCLPVGPGTGSRRRTAPCF